jgi:hypothetical protein
MRFRSFNWTEPPPEHINGCLPAPLRKAVFQYSAGDRSLAASIQHLSSNSVVVVLPFVPVTAIINFAKTPTQFELADDSFAKKIRQREAGSMPGLKTAI